MRRFIVLFGLSVAMAMGSGCATTSHFTKLPKPDEFKKPLPQLKQEYSDLTKYESPGIFVTIFDMPEAGPLKDAWSEPQSTGFTAWMLLPIMWLFHPSNYWYWEFEGKRVSALIDRPIGFGYQPHVWKLKIEENK